VHRLGVEQSPRGLDTGQHGRGRDDEHHEQPREVLSAAVPVGEPGLAGRRANTKATHSGTAVSASARLCTASANNATEAETIATISCRAQVTPRPARLSLTARIPAAEPSSAASVDAA
jgi:hypothetical protein